MSIVRESGVFAHFDAVTLGEVEALMKELILATDITRQREFLLKLKVSLIYSFTILRLSKKLVQTIVVVKTLFGG